MEVTVIAATKEEYQNLDLAVRIALETSVRQAHERTGISRRKIKDAIERRTMGAPSQDELKSSVKLLSRNPAINKIAKETIKLGVEKASDLLSERIEKLTGLLYDVAEGALEKSNEIIKLAGGIPDDDWKVAQLKLLTETWSSAIRIGKLLGENTGGDEGNVYNIDARQVILTRLDRLEENSGVQDLN